MARTKRRLAAGEVWAPGAGFDIVAIGASAGGLNAITEVLKKIPKNFRCSIMVVQHIDRHRRSQLADLLQRHSALPVKQAVHGEVIVPGVVYVAPPDEHMLVGPGKIQLAHTQLVHFSRPSVDLMFESVAGTYGSRALGLVLSGALRDGAEGVRAIKEAGGTTMAQEPATAEFASMPKAAIATGCVDYVLPLDKLGITLGKLYLGRNSNHG